jgi:hypothetical protein
MTHSNTSRILAYWEAQRIGLAAPLRSAIDPAAFADVVAQAFIIGRERSGVYPFRLAGALLHDLHRSPLTGLDFAEMWSPADRRRVIDAVEAALSRSQSLIMHAHGRSLSSAEAHLEILLAPLAGIKGQVDRLLGFYQPVSPLVRLQNQPIERLFLLDAAFADGEEAVAGPLRLAAVDGRRIA